ncbi:MAG: hypothetical protein KME14_20280 [Tildeniella torsiva UHER 1998/13D]|jgi:hypothetical protein|nr:hypothetical protein [Tildeniella torsiva UHER 1998/13D]
MANVKINDLSPASAVTDEMQFEVDTGGTTSEKVTGLQIKTYAAAGGGGGLSLAHLERSADLAIAASGFEYIPWDVEVKDDNAYWNSGAPTQIIATAAGYYSYSFVVREAGVRTGMALFAINKNGSASLVEDTKYLSGETINFAVSGHLLLEADDYIEVGLANFTGSTLTITDGVIVPTFIWQYLGA